MSPGLHRPRRKSVLTLERARAIAAHHRQLDRFMASYREVKPWWAFWISEAEAAWDSLRDCDLLPIKPPPRRP